MIKQDIACLLCLLLGVLADGIMDAFGLIPFAVIGGAMALAALLLVTWGYKEETREKANS